MNKPKNQFPLKIIFSYLVLGAIAVVVSYFLYTEYKNNLSAANDPETAKIIETGTLINDVYETDSFSRIALLTKKEEDFDTYLQKTEALYEKIDELKRRISDTSQIKQLDSVKKLLALKSDNIEELRIFKLISEQDTSFDDILREFKNVHRAAGAMYLEDMVKKPWKLNPRERRIYQDFIDYFNRNVLDTVVGSPKMDTLIKMSRNIVLQIKRQNFRARKELQEKENELLQNELEVSSQLRNIITDFDEKMNLNNAIARSERLASEARTDKILRLAGILGALVMVFFSYLIVTDFFKTEKYKKRLREEKEYSEDLLKSREQLMATVSHDLKTPLNTIVGYSELFTHTELNEKQENYANQIASSAHFISKMADDLLDFSKLEAGKLVIEHVSFSLEKLLHQIAKAAKDMHIQKPVDLHLYIDEALHGQWFESDPLRIQQVVNNLVSNAYKFTDSGRIQITANLLKKKKDVYRVELAVTDSGIGISEEKQQLIFKEFTQAEKDTFQRFGGSGLGLAISKKISQLLGGSLKVKSTLGEGSTFFFTLPLPVSTKVQHQEKMMSITPVRSSLNALIFDDDPAMLALLKELFEQMNINANGFTSFHEFKKKTSLDFDFVLTDIEMPDHTGFEILEALKGGTVASYKQQPVIAMTGTKKMAHKEYLDVGFTDMLQKPFSKNQLIAALSPLFLLKIESNLPALEVFKNPSHELFDLSFMHSFLGSDEGLNDVLAIFYQQSEDDLVTLREAVQEEDHEVFGATAHRMLTMCRQLGAKRVVPVLETMEHAAQEDPSASEMESLFVSLKIELEKLLSGLKGRSAATA
ncbi:MAG: ATP-binding protein [Bacteroidota bacterium]